MKHSIIRLFVFFFAAFYCFADNTAEILTSEYQPYSGVSGPALGCELINTALAREGVTVKWTILPIERQKILVADGTNMAMAQSPLIIRQDDKPNFILNDNPYLYLSVVAFYSKAKYPSGLGLKSADDLKNKVVGVVRGTGSVGVLQKAGAMLDIADDKDLLMKKLIAGRYDIAVIADLTGLYSLQALNKIEDYGYEPLYSSPLDLIFSVKNPGSVDLRKKYNSGLAKIKADGTFIKILTKYYPNGKVNKDTLPKDMR
jgi:polar amino acid transport system substrate-binding protein